MPTYGYRCSACGHEFERVQKMTDAPLTECETCSGPVKKILYPVGIAFKGSGFYVNDYKPGGPKTPAAAAPTETKADTPAASPAPAAATTESSKPAEAPKAETKTPAS